MISSSVPPPRHPFWAWPAGWFLVGIGLVVSDVFSLPRHGPLWAAFVLGALGWALAGAGSASLDGWRRLALALVWAGLFAAALTLGLHWGNVLEGRGGAGFLGLVGSLGLGGAAGGVATTLLERRGPARALAAPFAWGVCSAAGAYAAVLALTLALFADALLSPLLGERLVITLAWGLAWSVGGAVAGLASRFGPAASDAAT